MSRADTWMIQGAHRGGTAIVDALGAEIVSVGAELAVADPQPGRAASLASRARGLSRTLRTRPVQAPGVDVLSTIDPAAPIVLASDDITGIGDSFAARGARRPTLLQVCARGTGGALGKRFALQGVVLPGDEETGRGVALLVEALRALTRPSSSTAITHEDALGASTLAPLRTSASRRTASMLQRLGHDPADLPGGTLAICTGRVEPMVVASTDELTADRRLLDHAVEIAARTTGTVRAAPSIVIALVCVVPAPVIHLVTVGAPSRRPRAAGLHTIAPPPPTPSRAVSSEMRLTD